MGGRRNGGLLATGVTVFCSEKLKHDTNLIECKRGSVIFQPHGSKIPRYDTSSAVRRHYSSVVKDHVTNWLTSSNIRVRIGDKAPRTGF